MRQIITILFISGFFFSCSQNMKEPGETSVERTNRKTEQELKGMHKAYFAAGCFWCEEAVFESMIGVYETVSGYSGGEEENPTYEMVGYGQTSHAESVEVYYDSAEVTFPKLINIYFASVDPTQVNGQGPDHGTQYRSIIFYQNEQEKRFLENYLDSMERSGKYTVPLAIELLPFKKFWTAEDYHQNYLENNPNDLYVIKESIPRLIRTQKQVPNLVNPKYSRLDK